jgi:hypothetical protein
MRLVFPPPFTDAVAVDRIAVPDAAPAVPRMRRQRYDPRKARVWRVLDRDGGTMLDGAGTG